MQLTNKNNAIAALLTVVFLSGCATQATQPETLSEIEPPIAENATPDEIQATTDLWLRIRDGFSLLENHHHPKVEPDLNWYRRHQAYLDRVVERADPYLHFIVDEVERRGMPTEMALLPIVESAFQPFAYSHGRASGIWQFISSTGRRYGMKQDWWYDGRRDIYASTHGALDYLSDLHRRLNNDWLLALAAYNSGEGNVRRAIRKSRRKGKGEDFWSIRPYLPKETRGYVPKLLAISALVADPEAHGVSLIPVANEPVIKRVNFASQIDLALAAELAELELDELYYLNPGYNRWATSPTGPHYLMLPIEKIDSFQYNLAGISLKDRVRWKRYKVRNGESLITVAKKHHTTVNQIKQINSLRGNTIRAGHHLIVPAASRSYKSYTLTADQRKRRIQNTVRGSGKKVIHIVQAGDTFWELARHHNVSVHKLAKWNGMAPRDPLREGQRLVIWSRNKQVAFNNDVNSLPMARPPKESTLRRIRYSVRRGDSLARISQKFNVSIHQLLRWNRNKVSRDSYLQPGQRLTLYVDVTRLGSSG